MSRKIRTPECDKVMAVLNESRTIGQFLEWLQNEHNVVLCHWTEDDVERAAPIHESTEQLLAAYFDIDLDKMEREKRRLLVSFRGRKR